MKHKWKGLLCLYMAMIMLFCAAMPAMAEGISTPPAQYRISHQPTLEEPYVAIEEYKDEAYGDVTEGTIIDYEWYRVDQETGDPDDCSFVSSHQLDIHDFSVYNTVLCKITIGEEPDEVTLVSDPITVNKAYIYTGATPISIGDNEISPVSSFLIDYQKTIKETTAEKISAEPGYLLNGWKLWQYGQLSGMYIPDETINQNVTAKPADYTLTETDYNTYMGDAPSSYRGLLVEPVWLSKYRFALDGQGNPIGQPTKANGYTVKTQEYDETDEIWKDVAPEDVTYEWYEWVENTYEVVDVSSAEGQIEFETGNGTYGEGVWTSDEYNYLDVTFPARAGDVVRVEVQSGATEDIDVLDDDGSPVEQNENGTYTIPVDGSYRVFGYSDAEFTAKITLKRGETDTNKVADGATLSNATDGKVYKCVATFANPATLVSNPVEYEKTETIRPRPTGGGGGVSRYKVKFNSNGGSEVEAQTVLWGRKAQEPDAPEKEGYTFDGWYTDETLAEVYDFETKVTKAITLYAKWVSDQVSDNTGKEPEDTDSAISCNGGLMCISRTYDDLDVSKWYHEHTDYVLENKLMLGVAPRLFAPSEPITRAELLTVLYRAEGEPATNRSIPFADVSPDAYYANAASWAKQVGIVLGYNENTFAPDELTTREQLATIMHRYAQYKGRDVSVGENTNILSYEDAADISEWAIGAMQYAVGNGLLEGKSETTLNPLDSVTRVELAAILHRFIEGK
ncbi:MAG: hypothetical protein E7409_03495 [Ruminococcaceae bacterium]|nr:hypothetical protein [Oscillospiraceae bacterium]